MSFADDLKNNQKKSNSERIKEIVQEDKLYDLDNQTINKYVDLMIQEIKAKATKNPSKGDLFGWLGIVQRNKNKCWAVVSPRLTDDPHYLPDYLFSNATAKLIKDKLTKKLKTLGFKRIQVKLVPKTYEVRDINQYKITTHWFKPTEYYSLIGKINCYSIKFSIKW